MSWPGKEEIARSLPEIADALHGQLCALSVATAPDEAEKVAANLAGARCVVLQFREAMLRQGDGDGQ